jgi:hypothetical protein
VSTHYTLALPAQKKNWCLLSECGRELHTSSSSLFLALAIYSQNAILEIKKCSNHVLFEILNSQNYTNFKKNRQVSIHGSSR